MSRRPPPRLTRQDHFNIELDRCTRVLQKLEAHSSTSPSLSPRRPLLKSHTMTSFDTYLKNHSPGVNKTALSSPSLGSFHHSNRLGNRGGIHGNQAKLPDSIGKYQNGLGKPTGYYGNTLGSHSYQGTPAWSLSSAANIMGIASGWYSKQKSQPSMDTDELCEFLCRKGLGDPREAMKRNHDRRSQEHEDRKHVVRLAERRQRDKSHVPYYLQKLQAQSFLDSAAANSKAEAFCEQQGVRPLRTASATYRTDQELNVEVNTAFSASGSETSSRTGSDILNTKTDTKYRKDLFDRISAWLQDCEEAKCQGEQPDPNKRGHEEGVQGIKESSMEVVHRDKWEESLKTASLVGSQGKSQPNALSPEGKPIKSVLSSKTKSGKVNKATRKVVVFLPNV